MARKGEKRKAYRSLVEKPEVKRPFGRPRHRWKDDIKKGHSRNRIGGHGSD
jgi:hypothetical protein